MPCSNLSCFFPIQLGGKYTGHQVSGETTEGTVSRCVVLLNVSAVCGLLVAGSWVCFCTLLGARELVCTHHGLRKVYSPLSKGTKLVHFIAIFTTCAFYFFPPPTHILTPLLWSKSVSGLIAQNASFHVSLSCPLLNSWISSLFLVPNDCDPRSDLSLCSHFPPIWSNCFSSRYFAYLSLKLFFPF